jgi:miniconductance mechanosensitive channel
MRKIFGNFVGFNHDIMSLPIEIYAFSKIQDWIQYEQIQSDIFDHVFAAVQTFNLRIFQNPTGNDFQSLSK